MCKFERYGGVYTVDLKPLPPLNVRIIATQLYTMLSIYFVCLQNFTEEDLILFEEYLFVKLLELYDWVEGDDKIHAFTSC